MARLARAHFGVATALVTLSNAHGQRLKAVDGALPDVLPPDLSGPSLQASTATDGMVVVPDTWIDERFRGKPRGIAVRWPRFYTACALTTADGLHLGALCLLDDLPRALDDAQRKFLREFAGLIAHRARTRACTRDTA